MKFSSIKRIIRNFFISRRTFTFSGLLLFGFWIWIIWFLIDDTYEKLERLQKLREQGLAGTLTGEPSWWSYNEYLSYVLWAAVIAFGIYWSLTILVAWYVKYKLKRSKYKVVMKGSYAYVQQLNVLKWAWFLYVGELVLVNKTSQKEVKDLKLQVVGIKREEEFVFDMKHLPYALYEVKYFDIHIKDPLQVFNFMVSRDDSNAKLALSPYWNTGINKNSKVEDIQVDAMHSKFMSDASESFFATREYRRGDSLKRIHWKNTAKTGDMVVRVPEDSPINPREDDIVINLYFPKDKNLQIYDASKFYGGYLSDVISRLRIFLSTNTGRFTLYINGGHKKVIKDVDMIDPNKLGQIIINEAVGQSKIPLSRFVMQNKLGEGTMIFTPAWDLPNESFTRVLVYKPKDLNRKAFRTWLNKALKAQQTGLQFNKFKYEKYGAIKKRNIRRQLKKLIRTNINGIKWDVKTV